LNRLGINRNIAALMAVMVVVGVGAELWVRFLPTYLEAVGGGMWVVAAYGALFSFLDAVYQNPSGWAADHFGRRLSLILFTLAAAVGYALYLGPTGVGHGCHLLGYGLGHAYSAIAVRRSRRQSSA
jgi:hypothetical protein